MKKIALFGASGRTGVQFLDRALAHGYKVRALVRTPSATLNAKTDVVVVQGDVLDATAVQATVKGSDLVVSLFGHVKGSPKDVQTAGTQNIIMAMKAEGVTRIVSLSGGALPYPAKDEPKFPDHLIRMIMRLAVPHVVDDAIKHHQALVASGLDWTIVRAPRLTDVAAKGAYRVGWVGVNASTSIGRADLATFILQQVEDRTFIHQMPFVSY
jgi:putative NADH-flavin reductase